MSLVNDMLRDLDKRRKDSSSGSAAVSLTPAPELRPGSANRPVMFYVIAALIIGAGIVAWFWLQQNGSGTTRELDIAPRLALDESAPVEDRLESGAELAQLNSERNTVESAIDNQPEEAVVESPVVPAGQDAVQSIAIADAPASEDSSPAIENEPAGNELNASADSIEVVQNQAPITAGEAPVGEGAPLTIDSSSNTTDLSQAPAEEVKNVAQRTPEERDVLAVQNALQLIADNDLAAAYIALEEEIVRNRYAHQTRETYAKLLINEGNLLGALDLTNGGLALSPNHSGFKKIKARLLIAQSELNQAVDLLLTRAPPVDQDLEYHEILATAQLASRDYEGALISYTGLVRQDQNQGKWWYGFAASQDSLGNADAARQGYSRAVGLSNLSANLRRRSQERLAVLSR